MRYRDEKHRIFELKFQNLETWILKQIAAEERIQTNHFALVLAS